MSYTPTAPGTITIDVPKSAVAEPDPIDHRLHQVLSSTLTYASTAEDPACEVIPTLCGHLFSLIDSTPTYDVVPPALQVTGHAQTDYQGPGVEFHLWLRASDDLSDLAPPTGVLVHLKDLRSSPPGSATGPIDCSNGTPTALSVADAGAVEVDGTVQCTGLAGVVAFRITVTDHGPNPPNTDAYHVVLLDGAGDVLYDWADRTTSGLGDLRVSIGF